MTAACRWVRWERAVRGHRVTKVPLTVTGRLASSTNELTWSTYRAATASSPGEGFGFVLGDGVGCYDLDDCISHGQLAEWAAEAIREISEPILFAEVSQSGKGVHIFVLAPEGPGRVVRDGARKIERYTAGRYIAMTGVPFDVGAVLRSGGPPMPEGLGERGTAIWERYKGTDAGRNALALEAARNADRLDELDRIIQGKGVLELMQFRLESLPDGEEQPITVEVKFQSILSEARQQQLAFSQLLGRLGIDTPKAGRKPAAQSEASSVPTPDNVTPLDMARRAAASR